MNPQLEESSSFETTRKVKEFYDRYPYPQPVDDLDSYRRMGSDQKSKYAYHHLFQPAARFREDHSILVAGCGTSQAARYALRFPDARVTGIDLSETSIRHTERLKQKYGLSNLDVRQIPVERAGELEKDFDHIVCTGVLHHLPDPDAGLAALREALKPEGSMHLMVYAQYGRTGIYMLQEYCRRLGVEAVGRQIADLVAVLKELPLGHPWGSC